MPTALVTGASRGLGRAVASHLAELGWTLVLDARDAPALHLVTDELGRHAHVVAVPGDVTDAAHRAALAAAASAVGPLDLVVNNAGSLGPSPLPGVLEVRAGDLRALLEVNVVAPLALLATLAPRLAPGARVVQVTSDAAVEAYGGWGAYGATKAALEQLSAVLAVERPDLVVLAVDPGDVRTDMHQAAFPGEDISDRPHPSEVAPRFVAAVLRAVDSGRVRVSDVADVAVAHAEATA